MKNVAVLTLFCLLAGCNAGNGNGLNSQGQPIFVPTQPDIDEPIDDGSIKPTLSSIQEKVFTPICSVCHGGANPAAGQNLSSIENTMKNIINVNSSNPQFKRVLPGDALQSYLYLKVIGNSQAGAQMPLGQQALNQETVDAIKQWIDDGALIPEQSQIAPKISQVNVQKNSVITTEQPLSTTSILSTDSDIKDSPSIDLLFNKRMNLQALTANEILITASNRANNITSTIQKNGWLLPNKNYVIQVINDHQLQIQFNNLDTDITHLTVELNNNDLSTITSTLGQALDGDSDGFTGGAFTYDITL